MDSRLFWTESLYNIPGIQNVSLFLCALSGLCLCSNTATGFYQDGHDLMYKKHNLVLDIKH